MPECKRRALAFLRKCAGTLMPASWVGNAIWPKHAMKPQGAGAAASRVLVALKKEGAVEWAVEGTRPGFQTWGWRVTPYAVPVPAAPKARAARRS